MVWLALIEAAWAGPCPAPTQRADVAAAADAVEAAWMALDVEHLAVAGTALDEAVTCAGEHLLPAEVAAFWRASAFVAYVDRDFDRAAASLRAARASDPTYVLPVGIAGPGHPLREMWDAAHTAAPPLVALPPPADGTLLVDGRRSERAPADRAWVFQHLAADGTVLDTAIQQPGTKPDYALPTPATAAAREGHPSRTMLVAGVGCQVAGLAALLGAVAIQQDFRSRPVDEGPLLGMERANHVLGGLGVGLTVAGGGLVVGSVALHRW